VDLSDCLSNTKAVLDRVYFDPKQELIMHNADPISIFLDESLSDELWILASRDPLTTERVKEASAELAAKGTLGFGKLWSWLGADVSGELSAKGSEKGSTKLQLTSTYRAMLLPDLIGDIPSHGPDIAHDEQLPRSGFVRIVLPTLELLPLPSFADYVRCMMIAEMEETSIKSKDADEFERTLSLAEKLTSGKRALTFCHRLIADQDSGLLRRLFDGSSEEAINAVFNGLSMSNDDQILGLSVLKVRPSPENQVPEEAPKPQPVTDFSNIFSSIFSPPGTPTKRPTPKKKPPPPRIVFLVLTERYVKRHLSAFAIDRPVEVFGKIAYLKEDSDRYRSDINLFGLGSKLTTESLVVT
jgi:hypothetical protein